MAQRRAQAVDRAVVELFRTLSAPGGIGMALTAIGGYGRGELAPGSDIDLLLACDQGGREESQAAFEQVLYPLWNAGFRVGHALRTIDECVSEASADLFTLTALLSIRRLAGSDVLVQAVRKRARDLVAETGFLFDLHESRLQRSMRTDRVADSQTPDLRDGPGGLRDLHIIEWLGLVGPDVRPKRPGLRRPDFGPEHRSGNLLWRARIALHRKTGGPSNILGFEELDAVAEMLGIQEQAGWSAPDRLMRMVHAAGARLDWAAETEWNRVARVLGIGGSDPITVQSSWRPEEWLAPFAEIAEHGEWVVIEASPSVHPRTEPARWSATTREEFLRILAAGDPGGQALELMCVAGLLPRLLPEWDDVDWRPQRDPYHRYPVGIHLVQTAARASTLLHMPDEAFVAQAVAQISDPAPLLLGALLHDIGKVGRGSHVPAGVEIAGRVLDRMGVEPDVRDLVVFLVAEHLLLSDTATRRDLEDRQLIADVASRIGTPVRLAMLYLLTVADAEATGPASATPWRMGLVRELVSKVSEVLEGGAGAPPLPDRVPASDLELASPRPGATEVRTHLQAGRAPETFRLTVVALDRPGLLSRIAGALTLSGLSILSAQALTTDDGIAVDTFEVGPAFDEEIEEERWRRFRTILRHAIEGRIDVRDRIERMREHYRPARTDIPVSVRIDQGASSSFTVVEVGAADRLGLLFDLARTFSAHGLDVHLAKVATYGPRVVDVFYVTDATGSKVTEAQLAAELERGLTEAVRPR